VRTLSDVRVPLSAAIVLTRVLLGPYVVDDAYITFRYAGHLADGLGFTYNPPDRVLGTTAPLLALLLTPAAALDLDLGWIALGIAAAADVATFLCVAALLHSAGGVAVAAFGLILAFWPGVVTYSVSGLETSLYVALHAAAFLALARERPTLAGHLGGLAVLCRLDGALLAGIVVLAALRRSRRDALAASAAAGLTVLPWLLFSVTYFGSVIPASVTAKAHLRLSATDSLAAFQQWFWLGPYRPLTLLATAGAFVLVRRAPRPWAWWSLWWAAYSLLFILTGAFGPFRWYFVPLLVPYGAALAAAAGSAARLVASRLPHISRPWHAAAAAGILAATGLTTIPSLAGRLADLSAGRERLYREVAERVTLPQTCSLAATEIGTLGYFYDGPVLDLLGLVSPEAVGRPMSESIDIAQPCWVVSYDDHLPPGAVGSAPLATDYELAWRRRLGPERELLVFRRAGY
jgi:hypothetical protein